MSVEKVGICCTVRKRTEAGCSRGERPPSDSPSDVRVNIKSSYFSILVFATLFDPSKPVIERYLTLSAITGFVGR